MQNDVITYFDSFGIDCFDTNILKVLTRSNKRRIHSNVILQSYESFFCGYFCLAYLISVEKNETLQEFCSYFEKTNLSNNDWIVVDLIKKYIVSCYY